jgi:hypothetical protein
MPSIWHAYTETCLNSMHDTFNERTLVVDNTGSNRGVPASWNLGIDYMNDERADWLVIVSASCRFSPLGGMDFIAALDDATFPVVEARYVGWHLIAFHRDAIERVGRFDENFFPAYWEDCDYSRRLALAYDLEPPYWTKVEVEVTIESFAHGIQLAGVECDPVALAAYYESKWGGPSSAEVFTTPFDSGKALDYWPERVTV